MTFYVVHNARFADQAERMRHLESVGACCFCTPAPSDVLWQSTHWYVQRNPWPHYPGRRELLIIPRVHVETMDETTLAAQDAFWSVIESVQLNFGIKDYELRLRSGAAERTGGTVRHLHARIIEGIDD